MATMEAQWVHMVGIAGAGMSGIAKVLHEKGVKVSGSDLQNNSITQNMKDAGIIVDYGHSSSNVREGVDLVVISSAVSSANCEVTEAHQRNIPVIKRGEMLARMMNSCKGIAIAGAHGKTTTTSMIYTVLAAAEMDPTFIVGGEIRESKLNACLGQGEYFVAEADESDASFLCLRPYIAVVTNIENDHLDYYKSFERIQNAFKRFIAQVRPDGLAFIFGGDPLAASLKEQSAQRVILYGENREFDYSMADWQAQEMGSTFTVFQRGECLGRVRLSVPGRHNALNALAAVAVAREIGLDFATISRALAGFQGTKRRFQPLGEVNGIKVIDDYAHHPTEIKATIEAGQNMNPGRLVIVFQPHRYSRTRLLAAQIGESFAGADLVILTGIYSAGEKPIEGVSSELIYSAAKEAGSNIVYIPELEKAEDYVLDILQPQDLLITMGAGDIWKLGMNIVERLHSKLGCT
jgi:UDP-N-acetylmuramate--alanine ligase